MGILPTQKQRQPISKNFKESKERGITGPFQLDQFCHTIRESDEVHRRRLIGPPIHKPGSDWDLIVPIRKIAQLRQGCDGSFQHHFGASVPGGNLRFPPFPPILAGWNAPMWNAPMPVPYYPFEKQGDNLWPESRGQRSVTELAADRNVVEGLPRSKPKSLVDILVCSIKDRYGG